IDAGGLSIAAGVLDDDVVTILTSGATGVFADKNVGEGKAVTLATSGSGVLTGTDAGNYVLDTSGVDAATADITPATLVLGGSFTASNKTYDTTTAAQIDAGALSIASGLFDGDVVTILTSGATGAFADKNVGD